MDLGLPRAHRVVFLSCAVGLLVALATRVVRYAFDTLPGFLDDLLGWLLVLQVSIFAQASALVGMFYHPLLLAVALVVFVRFMRREDGLWSTAPVLHSILWLGILASHYLFDVYPRFGWIALLSLALATPWPWRFLPFEGRRLRVVQGLVFALLFVFWVASTDYGPEQVAIFGWCLVLVLLFTLVARFVVLRDRVWLGVVSIAVLQLVAGRAPLLFERPNALGQGMAYSFCDAPAHGKLYAVLPECPTLPQFFSWEQCKQGYVVEYDLDTLERTAVHRFFTNDFYGRIEQLTCLEDTVQVGMSVAVLDGVDLRQNAMEFDIEDPRRFRPNIAGERMGDRIAYDPTHDAVWYVSEWSNRVVRHDGNGDVREHRLAPSGGPLFFLGATLEGSLLLSRYSIHPGRNSIFLAEWLGGFRVREIDLTTFEEIATYRHNNGGAIGVAVDADYDVLYITGLWGMSVWDLRTGEPIRRVRLGFFNRVPVIDTFHDVVYVPSTVEGRLRIFDRGSFRYLASIATGYGVRHPHLTTDGRHFIASSERAFYRFDAENLAARARAGRIR